MIMGSWQIYILGVWSLTTAFGHCRSGLVWSATVCYPPITLALVCPLVVAFLSF